MKSIIHKNDPKNHNMELPNALGACGRTPWSVMETLYILSLQGGVEGSNTGRWKEPETQRLRSAHVNATLREDSGS